MGSNRDINNINNTLSGSKNIRIFIFSRIHRIRPRKTKYPNLPVPDGNITRVMILNFQRLLRSSALSSVFKTNSLKRQQNLTH